MFVDANRMDGVPQVGVTECAAAMLDAVLNGFEKEPLDNDDLNRLGRKALEAEGSGQSSL